VLKLPLTLAIIKSLLLRIRDRLYAIPLNAVVEISRASEADVHRVDNHEVLQLRNTVLTLVRMGRATPGAEERKRIFVVVIALGEQRYGLIVDSLVGEEELVIKPLDDQVISSDLVSGASILGDGTVVLMLNLAAVVQHYAKRPPETPGVLPLPPKAAENPAAGGAR
jgi:two-component system chemotaxis sensor kinase CheA